MKDQIKNQFEKQNESSKISILHTPEQTDIVESLYDSYILNNYKRGFENLILDYRYVDDFIEDLKKEFPKANIKPFKVTRDFFYYIEDEEFFINLTYSKKKFYTDIYVKNLNVLDKLYNQIFKKYEKPYTAEAEIKLTKYALGPQGLSTSVTNYTLKDYKDINEKFYPYIDIDLFMNEFIAGKENILILCGAPGTGKTKFASLVFKKLLENPDFIEYFENQDDEEITSKMLNQMLSEVVEGEKPLVYYASSAKNTQLVATDDFWNRVRGQDLVILDDLDFLLSSRDESREDTIKNQFISNLLSFSDGIEKINTKIIITTNQPFESIDEALLRKGRLFSILEFRPLTYEEALEVWKSENLDEKEFEKIYENISDKEGMVKHSDLGEVIQNLKRNKKYISKKAFILDDSIDVLRKAKKRRAGLI
jgi:SpoVK/Ycf46/Vps4 family AAA+-type ATPase